MPRIPQGYLDCVVFLYCNREDAEQGLPKGGSGFIVGDENDSGTELKLYLVTNMHVAKEASVAKFHRLGKTLLVDIPSYKWIPHPQMDDVGAVKLEFEHPYTVPQVSTRAFVTQDFIKEYEVSPGMESFMMGRLTGRDGRQQTNPCVRFGHLAMMPDDVIRKDGLKQESYLVDLMSLSGHSGSPVFIYESSNNFPGDKSHRFFGVRLLGINWGFYRRREQVLTGSEPNPQTTNLWLDGNSGFACVIPCWKITELLADVDDAGDRAKVNVLE